MDKINTIKRSLTPMYALHQSVYWIVVCCIISFSATFLTEKGLDVATVGIVLFSANMMSFVVQLFLANLADKAGDSRAIKTIMLILSGISLIIMVILLFAGVPLWLMAILYIPMAACFDMELPLMNSVVVFYSKRSYIISYVKARAVAAIVFGLASLGVGYAIKGLGSDFMLILAITFTSVYILLVFFYPAEQALPLRISGTESFSDTGKASSGIVGAESADISSNVSNASSCVEDAKPTIASSDINKASFDIAGATPADVSCDSGRSLSLGRFIVKYKWYVISLGGVMFFGASHLASENYMIEVMRPLGGDSSTVGIALMIATFLEMPGTLVAGKVYKKLKAHKIWMLIGISYTIRMLLYVIAGSIGMIFVAQALQMVSYAFLPPSQLYYSHDCVNDRDLVKGQSASTAMYSLGNALGNLFGGLMVSAAGVAAMLKGCLVGAFIGLLFVTIFVPFAIRAGGKFTMKTAQSNTSQTDAPTNTTSNVY